MKKLRKVLISLLVVLALGVPVSATADAIDDALICPGLQTILNLYYDWVLIA